MAKQTFTVGQVLTAAQVTSLQQTAMLGGSATAKTTSYTLVAADAGTVVSVNSTSATTITVNTGLFSAGDIVTIQNWGTGSVTITAGTATVNTAGSLIVPQYDGGILYFTTASAAIYFDWVQAGATSPLTTKGDIWVYGSSDTRLPIGTNNYILTADSSQTLGMKWAAAAGGGKVLQVVSTTKTDTFTVSTTTLTDITGLSVTITPTLSSSTILVLSSVNGSQDPNVDRGYLQLERSGNPIFVGDSAGSRIRGSGSFSSVDSSIASSTVSATFLDNPATTSSITYKWKIRSANGSPVYINRTKQDNDDSSQIRMASTITVLEIGA